MCNRCDPFGRAGQAGGYCIEIKAWQLTDGENTLAARGYPTLVPTDAEKRSGGYIVQLHKTTDDLP